MDLLATSLKVGGVRWCMELGEGYRIMEARPNGAGVGKGGREVL